MSTTTTTKPNASEQAAFQQQAAQAAVSIVRNEGDAKANLLLLFVLLVKSGTLKVSKSTTKEGKFVLRGAPKAAPTAAALVEQHLKNYPDGFLAAAWAESSLVDSLKGSNLTRILAAVLAYLPNATSMPSAELFPACQQAIAAMGGQSPITVGARLLKAQPNQQPNQQQEQEQPLPKADQRTPEQHEQFLAQQFAMLAAYAAKHNVAAGKVAAARKAAGIK